MTFVTWIILGLVVGFVSSKLANQRGNGLLLDTLLGIVGAVVGGWLFNGIGASGVTRMDLYSVLVAVIGAFVALVVYHLVHHIIWRRESIK